jgi:hypothetical protein
MFSFNQQQRNAAAIRNSKPISNEVPPNHVEIVDNLGTNENPFEVPPNNVEIVDNLGTNENPIENNTNYYKMITKLYVQNTKN